MSERQEVLTWLRSLRRDAWQYLAIAAVITAMMAGFTRETDLATISVRFLINLIISLSIGVVIELVHAFVVPLFHLERRSRWTRATIHGLVIMGSVILGVVLSLEVVAAIFPESAAYFPLSNVIRVAIPVTVVMVAISLTVERLRTRAEELERRESDAQRQLLKSQLEALRARTDPHFLFNALNTIAALIAEEPARAERAVEKLSSLLRYALEGSRKERVSLKEEITAVESYLEFQRLRFGDRLTSAVEVDPAIDQTPVPPLILQPLVENAINHGVAARRGAGRVIVTARKNNGSLELVVEDDGPGPGGSTHSGTKSSQADLQARLQLLYGSAAGLTVGRGVLGGFRVEVRLPAEESA